MSVPRATSRLPSTLLGSARVFFGFGSPRLLGLQLLMALAVRPLLGRPTWMELAIAVGVLVYWPLQEWFLHKFVLHMKPVRVLGRTYETAAARTHRLHHESPAALAPSLLPTSTIAILIPIHVALWAIASPSNAVACTGIVTLGAAALSYEWIHFLTHTAHKPRSRWFRDVKRRHMAHHQRDPSRWFAFTVPQLDDWLGTGDPRA